MDKTEALARLRAREPELRAMGVERLSLFGSTARGDQTLSSDVDIAISLADADRMTLLDFVGIQLAAETILGTPVDLVKEPVRRPHLQTAIDRDRIHVF